MAPKKQIDFASKAADNSYSGESTDRVDEQPEIAAAMTSEQIREQIDKKRLLIELRQVELEEARLSAEIKNTLASKISGERFSSDNFSFSSSSRNNSVLDLPRILKTLKCLDIPIFSGVGPKVIRDYDIWLEAIKKSLTLVPAFSVFFQMKTLKMTLRRQLILN
jgi:hypothetical protein